MIRRLALSRFVVSLLCASLAMLCADAGSAQRLGPGDFGEVQSLDVVAEGTDIHLLVAGKRGLDADVHLYYLYSRDAGHTWSAPQRIDTDGRRVLSRRGNDVQLAVRGRKRVAAWQREGELPGSGPMALAYSGDGGRTWHAAQGPRFEDPTETQSYLDLAVDRRGIFHLVWLDDREERGDTQGLRYARSTDGGRHWHEISTIDEAVCTCCWNRLTVLPDGSLVVLYRDDDPHDMKLARLPSGARRWREHVTVGAFAWHFSGCPHCGGGLAVTRAWGRATLQAVVWTGEAHAAGLYHLSRPLDPPGLWSRPARVAESTARQADIAAADDGRIVIVYAQGSDIHELRSNDGHVWVPGSVLNAPGSEADHPRVVATPRGFYVFWTQRGADAPRRLWMADL